MTPEPGPVTTGFVAAAATSGDVATQPDPARRRGRERLEPAGREWGATQTNETGAVAAPASAPRRFRIHPVLLVAIYAAAGIGVVVLVSTVLLGGSSSPDRLEPANQGAADVRRPSTPEVAGSAGRRAEVDAEAEAGEARRGGRAQARRDVRARERAPCAPTRRAQARAAKAAEARRARRAAAQAQARAAAAAGRRRRRPAGHAAERRRRATRRRLRPAAPRRTHL